MAAIPADVLRSLNRVEIETRTLVERYAVDQRVLLEPAIPTFGFDFAASSLLQVAEGLAVASWHGFVRGRFSADPARPLRVDATTLAALTDDDLSAVFQVGPANPLVGLAGRVELLHRLGAEHISLPARDDVPTCCGAPLRVIGDRTGLQVVASGSQTAGRDGQPGAHKGDRRGGRGQQRRLLLVPRRNINRRLNLGLAWKVSVG